MKRLSLLMLLVVLVFGFSGCVGTKNVQNEQATPAPAPAPVITQNIPASASFAKIDKGMGTKQVTDLLGYPDDTNSFITGKSFIPWYYGRDTHRTVYFYKNQGRIVFGGNQRVVEFEYDPSEDGYK